MSSNFVNFLNLFRCPFDTSNDTSTTVTNECKDSLDSYFYLYTLIPATVITLLFALTKKRRTVLPSVLWGRPGVVYAMDSMTRRSKISYACAFGAAAHVVQGAVISQYHVIPYEGHRAVKSLLSIVSMLLYGMTYLPVFLSLTMGSLFGFGLGTLYVWMLTIKELHELTLCDIDAEGRVLLVFRNLPHLLCLLYLSFSIPLRFVHFVYNRRACFDWTDKSDGRLDTLEGIRQSYDGNYVRGIFSKPEQKTVRVPEDRKEMIKLALLRLIRRYVYRRKRELSLHVVFSKPHVLLVTAVVIYMMTYQVLAIGMKWYRNAKHCYKVFEALVLFDILKDSLILSTVLALMLFIFSALGVMTSYRKHMIELYKGTADSSMPRAGKRSPVIHCMSYIKYSGYQAAYMITAFVIQLLAFLMVFIVLGVLIRFIHYDVVAEIVNFSWPYLLTFGVVNAAIWLMSKFFFLEGDGSSLALKNRDWFFNCVYFATFYFVFLGFFSSILRMFISMFLGFVYLGRLDKTIMVKNFEFLDLGFNTYVGFLKTDHAHTHPVVVTFTRLMLLACSRRQAELTNCTSSRYVTMEDFCANDVSGEAQVRQRNIARHRWHLVYTLHHNPFLRNFRKGYADTRSQSLM